MPLFVKEVLSRLLPAREEARGLDGCMSRLPTWWLQSHCRQELCPCCFKGIHLGGVRNCTGPSPGEPRARSQVREGLLGLYWGSSAGSPGTRGGDPGKREGPESPERTLGGRVVSDTQKIQSISGQNFECPSKGYWSALQKPSSLCKMIPQVSFNTDIC